jgi:hypothetical protein
MSGDHRNGRAARKRPRPGTEGVTSMQDEPNRDQRAAKLEVLLERLALVVGEALLGIDDETDPEAGRREVIARLRAAGRVIDGADAAAFQQTGLIGGEPLAPPEELPEGIVEAEDAEEDVFAGIDRVAGAAAAAEDDALRVLAWLRWQLGYEAVAGAVAEADADWVWDAALRRAFAWVQRADEEGDR